MKKNSILSVMLTLSIIISSTGCNLKSKNSKTKEIKVFTSFLSAPSESISENNRIQQLIAEKTGAMCKETWLDGKNNAESIISNMIISNEYPDFIYPEASDYQRLLNAKAFIPIDEYWDDYPNLKNYFSESEWNRIREDDGHIYKIPSFSKCYMYDTSTVHNDEAFWVQVKVLQWAGYPKINTLDEYFDLLEKYVEANPIGENGEKNIAYEILADESIFFCLDNPPQFLDGYPNDGACIVDTEKMEAIDYNTTPTAEKWFRKLNEEYHKGIIDPECFLLTPEQYYEKIKSGNVLGMVDQYWNFRSSESVLPPECKYVPLGIVIEDGIEEHYHSQIAFDHSSGIGITVSCDDVDAALKFLNDLLDPEILNLRFWGIEGVDYSVDENGLFYLTEEQSENNHNSQYAKDNRCLYKYFPYYWGMNQDGINAYAPSNQPSEFYEGLSDIMKECFDAYGVKTYVEMLNPAKENAPWYPMWSYTGTFTNSTDYGKAKNDMDKMKYKYLPKVVMSDDFDSIWNEYMKEYSENCNVQAYIDELNKEIKRCNDLSNQKNK